MVDKLPICIRFFIVVISLWSNFILILTYTQYTYHIYNIISVSFSVSFFVYMAIDSHFFGFDSIIIFFSSTYLKWNFAVSLFICIFMTFSESFFFSIGIKWENNTALFLFNWGLISSVHAQQNNRVLWQNDKYINIFISFFAYNWEYILKQYLLYVNQFDSHHSISIKIVIWIETMNTWTRTAWWKCFFL